MLTPKVKVSFYMSGDDVDLDILTEQIGIKPTKVRKKSEWPQVSISMGIAKDSWLLEMEKEECIAVSTLFDKLQKILFPKTDIITALSKKYALELSVTIVVEMEVGSGPELVLTKENIAFLALVNAEVGFDLYIDN